MTDRDYSSVTTEMLINMMLPQLTTVFELEQVKNWFILNKFEIENGIENQIRLT